MKLKVVPLPVTAASIGARLRAHEAVTDEAFDALLPEPARTKSRSYWSSVQAAQVASRLLYEVGVKRLLDAGSGIGKFCAVASLDASRRVWGVERRGHLVAESRNLAKALGADVVIMEGSLADVDPSSYDGFYFYNPFGEYVAAEQDRYDASFPGSFEAYIQHARLVERWLRAADVGTAMVTYNGLGGRIPASFRVRKTTHVRDDVMRLWVKEKVDDSRDAFLEIEEELMTASELAALAKSEDGNALVFELSQGEGPTCSSSPQKP